MQKLINVLTIISALFIGNANAASQASEYISSTAYNQIYPYMNSKMKSQLASFDTNTTQPKLGAASVYTRTRSAAAGSIPGVIPNRRVVRRTTSARSATNNSYAPDAVSATRTNSTTSSSSRRVVKRTSNARSTRADGSYANVLAGAVTTSNEVSVSAARCLADYTACMNEYCERENTEYNRCYCSAKLAQIDAKYQDSIQSLIMQIIDLQYDSPYTESEMQNYWQEKIVQYTGSESWIALDDALDIDWSTTQSRGQGQETFLVGHEYCVQHIQGCYYMASNLRDAYVSDISRDCASYESGLQAIENVAKSVVEYYSQTDE